MNNIVSVITNDGRHLVGLLIGYDLLTNLVLSQSHERIYSMDKSVEQLELGLYIIRGDNVAIVGEVDEDKDLALDFNSIRAPPLKPISH